MGAFHSPICVALDAPEPERIRRLAETVRDSVGVYKLGLTSIYGAGTGLVAELGRDRPVFLDAKLHDIPAQVEGAVAAIEGLGATFVTVHAAGGFEMVKSAIAAAGERLQVLAVTVLTSLDDSELERLGFRGSGRDAVLRLAEVSLDAGAPGLVCSPLEVGALRKRFGPSSAGGPLLVVPGVRPSGSGASDQRRTHTPRATLDAGADLLVIGRPITGAGNPEAAAASIVSELS